MSVSAFRSHFGSIKIVGPNDKVFKEECVCSFETAESPGGLYISMNRFEAISEDFLDYYFERYNDPVYLHHKRLRYKLDKAEAQETKPKRLAIGLEGGFCPDASERDKIEDIYSIIILPSGEKFNLQNQDLPEIVIQSYESIIKAQSSETTPETTISIWDGEQRQVSKYAANIEQQTPARMVPPTGWKCDKCDLTQNLWLNLTDGSILCGRRFFDGSGGNNHAVEHYTIHRYPLAVKLGTITSSGADVYSYAEEDMVIDPFLDKHLAHFGIDVQQMIKTEKSIIELEIDMNEKVGEWSIIQEEGKNLEPVSGPGFTGLINLGNSCYMNSVLQVLFNFEEFQKRYFPPSEVYNLSAGITSFNHQMAKICYGLLSGKYSEVDPITKSQKGIAPKAFKNFVCGLDRNLATNRQQDAHEFFLFITDLIERNARECRKVPGFQAEERYYSDPTKALEFIVEDRFQCSESNKVKYTHRVELCLPLQVDVELAMNRDEIMKSQQEVVSEDATLSNQAKDPLRPTISLMSCIDLFHKSEKLCDFFSNAVQRRTTATKQSRIARFPKYFMFQMKKFQYGSDWVPKKMDVSFDVPDILDLEFLEGKGLQPGEELLEENEATSLELGAQEEQQPQATSSGSGSTTKPQIQPDSESVAMLLSMGIDSTDAIAALRACNNDAQRAIEYIFDPDSRKNQPPPEDAPSSYSSIQTSESRPERIKTKLAAKDDKPKLYQLRAFISHMGTTTMCGHYVCHIKKDERWYIFNDNKVALSENPPKEFGYLYFYERILA